jgi:hypothetical protein
MCDEPWSGHVKHDGHCGMILWAALGTVPACVVEGQCGPQPSTSSKWLVCTTVSLNFRRLS